MSRGEGKSTSSPKESKKSSSNNGVRERGNVRPLAGSPRPTSTSTSQPQLSKKKVGGRQDSQFPFNKSVYSEEVKIHTIDHLVHTEKYSLKFNWKQASL